MHAIGIELLQRSLWLVLLLAGPPIIAATVVGLVVAILQAVTQVQEQTVQFLCKLIAVGVTLFLASAWIGGSLVVFSEQVFSESILQVR